MIISYAGKTVFITGASSGIGAELARQFAREGARVVLAARRLERLEGIRKEIEAAGGTACGVECDVTSRASIENAVARAVAEYGGIDVAIANAGFGVSGEFSSITTEDFRRQFDTNVFGVIDTIYAVLPHLKTSQGQVGIVASVMGRMGAPVSSAYCSSKFALVGLAESIYYELIGQGIAVTCINPGVVASDIRRVDNKGKLHEHAKDPVPSWLIVPTPKAAGAIIRALRQRKPEAVITGHGKVMASMARHWPRTLRFLIRMGTRRRARQIAEAKRGV